MHYIALLIVNAPLPEAILHAEVGPANSLHALAYNTLVLN